MDTSDTSDTRNTLHEHISALADGELADSECELALAALGSAEGSAAWHAFHRIGDVLREEAASATLSAGFSASLARRLAAEPALHCAPSEQPAGSGTQQESGADADAPRQGAAPASAELPLG